MKDSKKIMLHIIIFIFILFSSQTACAIGEEPGQFRVIWDSVWRFINFFILAFCLYKLTKKPITDFLQKQKEDVIDSMKNAEDNFNEVESRLAEQKEKFSHIDDDIKSLETRIMGLADKESAEIINTANKDSEYLIQKAKFASQSELNKAKKELTIEMMDIAINKAKQHLQKFITQDDHDRLISKYATDLSNRN